MVHLGGRGHLCGQINKIMQIRHFGSNRCTIPMVLGVGPVSRRDVGKELIGCVREAG